MNTRTCESCGIEYGISARRRAANVVARAVKVTVRAGTYTAACGGLFLSCHPSTVARFVMPIRVDAVDAEVGAWAFPHIGQEMLEFVLPAVTDSYAAEPVAAAVIVAAPIEHAAPDLVGGAFAHPVSAQFLVPGQHHFAVDAATALRSTASQVSAVGRFCAAAVAPTFVERQAPSQFGKSENGQASKSSPCGHWGELSFGWHV